ncbi:ATPase associated with various cellular activities AAA_3 [Solidesulfovibrio fructosivorans JJ]]|uniref:ATPase associated with various cellular activities AAA_3 n=1 Tax=Solidesulfovibrio fructosivorans JJ] TaxID=596151 RepID=E1JTI2_SOLFR|nr:MoxR family ATPase [Solidesulfovibrio fructosivorans]EFL52442.1 ATPase associated with various cellular activities AAA_3 [Solidesulfovibrio fructosivorans JJ]]
MTMIDPARLAGVGEAALALRAQMAKVLVGRAGFVDRLVIALLCRGHVLIEGVPGLAKTLAVKTLARTVHGEFRRVQFTPDLLPADICGMEVYQPATGTFSVRKGPVFANILLADEINRAPSKVQAALLEAMAERRVTIGGETFSLPEPFFVLATQNPIEQEGTYPLPEAQVDRFLFQLVLGYPSAEEEKEIVRRGGSGEPATVEPVISGERVLELGALVAGVRLDARLLDYIVALVGATRDPGGAGISGLAGLDGKIAYGASPRASIALARTARGMALLDGRDYATPGDIKALAPDVLRHRILLTYEAQAEGLTPDAVVRTLLENVPVP